MTAKEALLEPIRGMLQKSARVGFVMDGRRSADTHTHSAADRRMVPELAPMGERHWRNTVNNLASLIGADWLQNVRTATGRKIHPLQYPLFDAREK